MSKQEVVSVLKFKDTLDVLGHDSEGNRKRGRPRGRKEVPTINAGKFCYLPVSVCANLKLEDYLRSGEVKMISIIGNRVSFMLQDNSFMEVL